jgi:P27 family predicted phage terminase small subunit
MGARGPAKQPAELKEHLGTRKKSRDPDPLPVDYALPSCPFPPKSDEAETWDRLLRVMKAAGLDVILTMADEGALEAASIAWCRARQATRDYANLSPAKRYVNTRSNGLRPHPALAVEQQSWAIFKTWCAQLGLSPSARASLSLDAGTAPAGGGDPEKDLSALTEALLHARPMAIDG